MFRKKHYVALGSVALAAVLVLNLPSHAAQRLKAGVSSLFLPLFGVTDSARTLPAKAINVVMPRSQLLKENERLQQENDQLRLLKQQGDAALQENASLRAAVGWKQQQQWNLKLARVVLRDPANWWHTVQIDIGTAKGVRENCPVLTSDGLVGRVSSAGADWSRVVLIGNPDCRVSARVANPAHDIGILMTTGPLDTSLLNLTYLSSGANLKAGQQVVTSGQGGVFPAGIPIGLVTEEAHPAELGLYAEARVKLSVNLGGLKEVWVLTNP